MDLHQQMVAMADRAKAGARALAALETAERDALLEGMARGLEVAREAILAANAEDVRDGERSGLSSALLDRLRLDDRRIAAMAEGIREMIALADPLGEVLETRERPSGLRIEKVRVPIGVIGIIYESRPNVTADAAALCIKAGNAVILRGGRESLRSNRAIAGALVSGAEGLPEGALQLVDTPDRDAVRELCEMTGRVDLLIPRGGEGLIEAVTRMARVPVIKHYKGVCHVYVDASADIEAALAIVENAKCQRPGVCNAMETMLVHAGIAERFLPEAARRLSARGVELRGDEATRALCAQVADIKAASEDDWSAEYLDLILAVRVVDDLDAAISHIARYGSQHSDAIVARDEHAQRRFAREVDSAAVYINASTRFTDGGEFGMGAEIGISTDKLHARGPMGLPELTTYKYVARGDGLIR
ncbi:MAG: glutamate-5-semialdehyde dehydrogenase [Myxococcales bacterium]|nr:glutamate-5-semialdehyde dehydrogenase [Myxococcales bacterium]